MSNKYRYKSGDPWRVVPFMLLGAVLQGGLAIGVSAADSLFISNIGADQLPVIYACMPLLMLAYISAYTRILNRWGIDRLFVATIGVLVVGGFGFSYLLRTEDPSDSIYYIAMFYSSLWYIALYSLLWNFIDGFFDLSEAKRLFGLIAGGAAVGAIGGGVLVSSLSEVMGVAWLFGVWATTVLMALPIVWWIVRNVPRIVGDDGSLFISNIGADQLPVIYACMPLLMLAYISAYTRILNRWGIDRLFVATIGVLVVGGFGFSYLLRTEDPSDSIYYIAMFYSSLWYIALYSLLWNFIDGFFDLSEAKRLFGLIAGGAAVGAIGGGVLVSSLSEVMGVAWLFGVWATTVLMALPIVWWIVRNVPRIVGDDGGEQTDEDVSLKDTLKTVLGSRYVTVLTLVIFTLSVAATLCEFRYYTIFEEHYPEEKALAGLFGQLYAGVNVVNLVVTLFLFRVMVRWFGVRNVAIIQPVVFLAVFGVLLLNGGFAAALFGFVAFQGVMTSIEYNNQNLLFNVLPEQGKEATRTFIEGICDPVATASAGIFLLGAQHVFSDAGLSGVGFGVSFICLILVLVLRVEFVKSMTLNVRRSWLDFSRTERIRSFVRKSDLVFLQERADAPTAHERERLAAMERLWQLDPVDTLVRLLDFYPRMTPAIHDDAGELLGRILLTDNPKVIDRCLTWAEENGANCDPLVLEYFGQQRLVPVEIGRARVRSSNPRDRAAGAVVLWESGRVVDAQTALRVIDDLLEGDTNEAESGWHALSMIGEIRFIPRLLPNLRSPDPVLRLRALHALQPLMGPDTSGVQRDLLRLMAGNKRLEERLLVIEAVKSIGDSAIIEPLLRLTSDTEPHERRSLEHMLTSFGPRGVPAAVKVLRGIHYPLDSRSIAAKALARVAFSQLEQMVPELIDGVARIRFYDCGHSTPYNRSWGRILRGCSEICCA